MPALFRVTALLVLPLAALLFAQWPLRDLVQAGSRTANDLAQIVFALYMAVAVTAASHAGVHLTAAHSADAPGGAAARWRAWALFACTAPWAVFLLWSTGPQVWQSVSQFERFGETLTPGYFLIKAALWLLAALALADAAFALRRSGRAGT
jgi:hypothetical protein